MPAPPELPRVSPPRLRELLRFDLTEAGPTALRVLRRHLGLRGALRVGRRYLAGWLRDPLATIEPQGWPRRSERLVRHQLRAAVRVDDALRPMPLEARLPILRDVIGETGARFIGANVPMPSAAAWGGASAAARDDFAAAVVQRFFNAETTGHETGPRSFRFDVVRCRFVQLCAALDRPYLAPLFCHADSVYFERPRSPLRLLRGQTLAGGDARCDFRFEVHDE